MAEKAVGRRRLALMKHLFALVLVPILIAACGSANAAQTQTLLLAFKATDTYKYALHSTTKETVVMGVMTIPVSADISGDETVTVKSVDASGTADLSVTLANLTIKTVTGSGVTNTTTLPSQTSEVKIASDGRPMSSNGTPISTGNAFAAFSALGGSFFISAVLPNYKVKSGDSWTKSYDQAGPDGSGTVHITSSSKYLRDESLKGINAAVVETKSTGTFSLSLDASKLGAGQAGASPLPGMALSGMTIKGSVTSDVTTWIDPSGHRVMKTHSTATQDGAMNIQSSALPGLSGPITLNGGATTDLNPA
jgi:hypothetical protein